MEHHSPTSHLDQTSYMHPQERALVGTHAFPYDVHEFELLLKTQKKMDAAKQRKLYEMVQAIRREEKSKRKAAGGGGDAAKKTKAEDPMEIA